MNGGEPTSSGISKTVAEKAFNTSKGIYTLNGVRLKAESLSELPSGLYIVDGKKVTIK